MAGRLYCQRGGIPLPGSGALSSLTSMPIRHIIVIKRYRSRFRSGIRLTLKGKSGIPKLDINR